MTSVVFCQPVKTLVVQKRIQQRFLGEYTGDSPLHGTSKPLLQRISLLLKRRDSRWREIKKTQCLILS
jgi:hypothetical protein